MHSSAIFVALFDCERSVLRARSIALSSYPILIMALKRLNIVTAGVSVNASTYPAQKAIQEC